MEHWAAVLLSFFYRMVSIHHYFARKQVGDTQKRGESEMRSSCRIHSICTDQCDSGPAAGLQVSPTSDTCQSVAILMNRRNWFRFNHICFLVFRLSPDDPDQAISFMSNREEMIELLERLGWPVSEEDVKLLEEEIHKGELFLQQSRALRQEAKVSRECHAMDKSHFGFLRLSYFFSSLTLSFHFSMVNFTWLS